MKRLLLFLLVVALAAPLLGYLPEFTTGTNMDHWNLGAFAVQWSINPNTSGSKISGGTSVTTVIANSFATWNNAPNSAIHVSQGTNSAKGCNADDGVNLISFTCSSADFSKDSSTLAVTFTTTSDAAGQSDNHGGKTAFAGQIIDADILFNPAVKFSTDSSGTGQDLQTVATHEIGHFLGLDHSAVVRAVMFPFAGPSVRTLGSDDVAGLSLLYPMSSPNVATGSVSGTITLSGAGVFGAHVFLDSTTGKNPFSGVRLTPIGTLSHPDGSYTISGVPPDSYNVTAEPLDLPVENSDVSGFAHAFGKGAVQTNFTTRWF